MGIESKDVVLLVLSIVLGGVVGGVIGWLLNEMYYHRNRRDAEAATTRLTEELISVSKNVTREADRLRDMVNGLARAFERARIIRANWDVNGNLEDFSFSRGRINAVPDPFTVHATATSTPPEPAGECDNQSK